MQPLRPTFRLLQANLLNARADRAARLQRFIASGAPEAADVLTLQEITDVAGTRAALESLGFSHFAASEGTPTWHGYPDYAVVASRFPIMSTSAPFGTKRILRATLQFPTRTVHVYSAHFPWGSHAERDRLQTAEALDSEAATLEARYADSFTVLGGDLNALPEARTLRYFKGLELPLASNLSSTSWLDAYELAGRPEDAATTDHARNSLGRRTAREVGVEFTETLPPRRIDYILARGWRYGRPGEPLTFGKVPNELGHEYSDHDAIWADIAL
jgi:endonuclease/exonuclease/phosphatase family metal-dependent hydrolase